MTNEHTPTQAGLDFAVKLDQDFFGKEALVARPDDGRRLCLLVLDDPNTSSSVPNPSTPRPTSPDALINIAGAHQDRGNVTDGAEIDPNMSAGEVDKRDWEAQDGGEAVGYVTSAAYAYTLGVPLAYAWLPAELTAPGTAVEIGYFGERYRAVVTAEPASIPR